ncbi:MAG: ferrous iron transport protein, partial [Planctomycetota bacterium]
MSPAVPGRTRTVALVGRANAGKTSLLMHLTGTPQRPVNFPGTSVERVESEVEHAGVRLRVVDLPGIASLTPMSRDEEVAIASLRAGSSDRPELLCAVLDATKLMLELRLLAQLRTLGLPVVVALTRTDLAEAEGRPVAVDRLQQALGIPVHAVHGRSGAGAEQLLGQLAGELPTVRSVPTTPTVAPEVQRQEPARRTWTDRLDAVLLHRVFGPVLLLLVLLLAFQVVFTVAEPFVALIESAQGLVEGLAEGLVAEGALRSLLVDGLVNGLGSVFVFIPQIA